MKATRTPPAFTDDSPDSVRIARSILAIAERYREQPSLETLAREAAMSEFHFQRVFRRWVGVSPKRFLQAVTLSHAKGLLHDDASLLEAAFETGLSGPGRLHDLFVSAEAVTPGEYKQRGRNLRIEYGIHSTPFGPVLLAVTERGICSLFFLPEENSQEGVEDLEARWSGAEISLRPRSTEPLVERLFPADAAAGDAPFHLHLRGTNFQLQVWRALLRIPAGAVTTYEEIARGIGRPSATRAVANAAGRNPISLLIPCHRVIRKTGALGGYRWGLERKRALLGWEAARFGEEPLDLFAEGNAARGTRP